MKKFLLLILVLNVVSVSHAQERKAASAEMKFSGEEVNVLFRIARQSIYTLLNEHRIKSIDPSTVPDGLKKSYGAFVTLNVDGKMRGCIGRFVSGDPLFEVVNQMAAAAASEDTRFAPVSKDEINRLRIEISVLGPLKKIQDTSEIIIGRHGIFIEKNNWTGTMLPQVASGNHWTREQFLGYTSRDKAGLGWEGWKNADIYIYETEILHPAE